MTGLPLACTDCTVDGCRCSESRRGRCQGPHGACARKETLLCSRCTAERLGGCGDGRGYPACQESRVYESGDAFLASFDELSGDPGWWQAHFELGALHSGKADGYGNDRDALANYVETSEKWGDCDEATPARRIDEKMTRARNLILAGRADEVDEWMDIASLALGAEALRRRRL